MKPGASCCWLCLAGVLAGVLSASCTRPQRVIDRYRQQYALMIGKPYHAVLEYVHERKSGYSFALANIELSSVGARSRLHVSFTTQLFTIDGQQFQASDLKGKLMVWQDGKKSVITMPDGFSFDTAQDRVSRILDELNSGDGE